ncbi:MULTISPECIES: hypothetical protein [Fictibacillus]|uniref:Uncharacterized protein n=1 Tax=Fictibacillus enclensis TaxID=1017270 RepID=A0A0V8JC86_9BACL|nr:MULTISPECIES: hypothetical protein [Fictibacillus]KSU84548.1 hypothetical protein AS030_03100 [Fictibacillus enclensis]RXY99815.1 hypothetical protein DMO16_09050 [Fictibacillus sp. S7]SCB81312.1 hypothetical protein GA0061096_0656 [Fictibacillus enclensis]
MWNITEEKLTDFKQTAKNRLSPDNSVAFMFGTMIWCSIVMFFIIFGLIKFGWSAFPSTFEKVVVSLEVVFYVLQIGLLFIFTKPKMFIKYQKSLSVLTLFYAFQLGTIGFVSVIIKKAFDYPNDSLTLTYVGLLIAGAVLAHILCTVSIFKQAEHGKFNGEDSSGFFFDKTIIFTMLGSVIYVVVLLILLTVHLFGESSLDKIFFYFILSVILYAVAIGAAEFQLLAYCKYKFPSFNISWHDYDREKRKRLKKYDRNANKKKKKMS